MVDAHIGFSFPVAFHYPSNCNCSDDTQHLYGTGIMIGTAMSDPGPIFSPYFTARNSSNRPLTVTPVFSYVAQDHTEKVSLPPLVLNAQETAVVNLRKYQEDGRIPMSVTTGSIDLQYQGESGALIAEMASVDENGTFVPPVPLVCNGNRALHMSFWRTDGDWHSSLALQNIATEENEVEVTISYPGGTYLLEKRIPAGGATMVSINELQQTQTPDQQGRRIPANATLGGLNVWSRNVNNGLVMNAMTMNPVTKTCGSCGATGYVNSYALTDTFGCTSGFGTYSAGDYVDLMMSIHWSTSNCSYENPQLNSSSDTSVVNTSLQAVGAGSTTLNASSYQSYPRDVSCSSYYRLTSQSGVNVKPKVTSITPSRGVQGATTSVTIAGIGFSSPATLNAGSGITVSAVTVSSSTSITANFAVAANATGGARSVTVTCKGKTSNSDKTFFVQVPSKLLPYTSSNLAPNGIGPLNTPINEDVRLLEGGLVFQNFCGVYRSYLFFLADQEGQKIQTAFTFGEIFSNINSAPGLAAVTHEPANFGADYVAIEDLQSVGFFGGCLNNNEFQTFTQKFKITINGTEFFPTTTINIKRGNEGGALKVDRTITTQ
jgi:hypothetical protein